MHQEGHQVLSSPCPAWAGRARLRRRAVAALAAGCLACLATAAAPATAASARAPSARAVPVTARLDAARFGRPAAIQLVKELLAAWRITRGRGVTVAVVGQGVAPSATGFTGRVTSGPSFGNVSRNSLVPETIFASAVAGAGPSPQNPFGTIGLAPQARILSVQIPLHAASGYWQSDESRAIRYAARHGARVIFLDMVGIQDDSALDGAVQYAESKDAVLIADEFQYGRDRNAAEFPASLPGVLGAASVLLPGLVVPPRHVISPANDSILVAAPGNDLVVSGPAGAGYRIYNFFAAAAWLTATVALIKSLYPDLRAGLVARAIAVSARNHPPHGYSTRVGFGLINPVGALHAAAALAKLPVAAEAGPGVAPPGARLVAGSAPGVINAVHHARLKLAGFTVAMAAGLILLGLAVLLPRRWRRRTMQPGSGDYHTIAPGRYG